METGLLSSLDEGLAAGWDWQPQEGVVSVPAGRFALWFDVIFTGLSKAKGNTSVAFGGE
jgi:hypothetical protein